jgi:protein-disulfide isomerase-like protein with CxxC motif
VKSAQSAVPQSGRTTEVDFWFDPVCPWTWLTACWMQEVRRLRPVRTRWHVMSLAVLNEHRDHATLPERYRELLRTGWGPVRVCAAAEQEYGNDVLGPLYTALGTRFHPGGLPRDRATMTAALEEAGLPASLYEAAESTRYDDAVRASHREGIELVGQDVGTPVLAIDDGTGGRVAFFGPVVTPTPRGEAAATLWDGLRLVASTPGFYELKRTRTTPADFT